MVPKAQAFSDDEEEKTTIESGWEEEASTTVEQGEVAEKIRALGLDAQRRNNITNVTSTNAGMQDELTVDDQRANAAISMITPMSQARLLITGGNDSGAELLVAPGKSYTIGRSVDNDCVLTDIAVSRKHFDLRYEAGSWVLVDRGSGNGTLVNNNIEDQPFMLANGDTIEIGNTTFRFEIPNGVPRIASSVDVSIDTPQPEEEEEEEDEPSTVAGKPLRADEIMTPSQMPPPAFARPKTLPPPAPPLRSRSPSVAPMPMPVLNASLGYPQPIPSAATTIPSLGQGNSARPMGSPTMLGDSMGMPMPNTLPTTIPGQGRPLAPSQLPPQQPYNGGYPSAGNHAQMLVVGNHIPRDATSTALVPPTPYNGMPVLAPQPVYAPPQISRRTKMILAGAGLTLFAAIATVAIIKGSSGGAPANGGQPEPAKTDPVKTAPPVGKTIQPIDPPPQTTKVDPPKKDPPKVDPPKTIATVVPPKVDPPKVDPPKVDPPKTIATVVPPKVDPPKKDPPKVDPPKVDPPKTIATVVPPKVDPPKKDPPKKDPPKKDPPKKDPPKKIVKAEPPPKKDPPKKDPAKKRVGVDTSGIKAKAEDQFKAKRFSEAAATLRAAAASSDPEDATDLKSAAAVYEQFGRAYNVAMAPGTAAKDAYPALKRAKIYDPEGVFSAEIQSKLAQVAPKAASSFMAAKNYAAAKEAVAAAEAAGGSNSTTQAVRATLETTAGTLYKEAMSELAADPAGAKAKLKQVQSMVDSKSSWYQKAGKALSGPG